MSLAESKAVLVTGGAKRVGRAVALHLAAKGWDVAIHYNGSHKEAAKTADEIRRLNRHVLLHQQDVAEPGCWHAMMQTICGAMPHLQALVNSASIFERTPFRQMTEQDYDRHMNINLKAPVMLMQAFAHEVKQGAIVNLIDTHITRNHSPFFPYLISKKALLEATKMTAYELAPKIRVNAVCPGLVLPSPDYDESYMQQHADHLPMKALATPEQVAELTAFLLEQESLTGQCLYADGGEQLV